MSDQGAQAGIATAIIGNVVLNAAINVRRHARQRIIHMAVHGITPPSKHDQLWYLGIFLAVSGELVNFLAYGLAPASVVSPLGVFAVISNCVIPALLFDESPHIHVVAGTMIALPGLLLCILSGPEQPPAMIDFPDWSPDSIGYVYAKISLGLVMTLALIRETMRKCGWACMTANTSLAAIMGSFGILGLKTFCLSLMRHEEPPEGNATYLAIFVVCTAAQLGLLGDSLKRFTVWQVVPLHFAFFTSFVSISSGLIFHEFEGTTYTQRMEFGAGLALITTGVWLSSKPHEPTASRNTTNSIYPQRRSDPERVYPLDKRRNKRHNKKIKKHKRRSGLREPPPTPSSVESMPSQLSRDPEDTAIPVPSSSVPGNKKQNKTKITPETASKSKILDGNYISNVNLSNASLEA